MAVEFKKIAEFITGKPRYIPEKSKTSNSVVYNIFRKFESVFGRKYGVRIEAMAEVDENAKVISREFFTLEAKLVYYEGELRYAIRMFLEAFGFVPQIFFPQLNFQRGAIGYDNHLYDGSGSFAYTVSGSDPFLIFCGNADLTDTGETITYNGVAGTTVAKTGTGDRWGYMNILAAPATGSNTLSVSGPSLKRGWATSYSGTKQTGQPDSSHVDTGSSATYTAATTVVDSDCWLFTYFNGQGANPTAGTGSTLRGTAYASCGNFDSNGAVGTGSQSMSFETATGANGMIIISIAPVAVAGFNRAPTMLNVF